MLNLHVGLPTCRKAGNYCNVLHAKSHAINCARNNAENSCAIISAPCTRTAGNKFHMKPRHNIVPWPCLGNGGKLELRLLLVVGRDLRRQTSDAVLEIAVLGGVDERVDAAAGDHQNHREVVEPAGKTWQKNDNPTMCKPQTRLNRFAINKSRTNPKQIENVLSLKCP